MVSAVQSRPNYYELLGLTPAASDDEITQAFAKAMGMFGFHPMALAAHLSAAFETLRNPAKRRDYDHSIGLVKEPEPRPQPWAIAQRGGTPFFGLPPAEAPAQRRSEPSPRPAPRVDPLHRPAAPAEPRVAPFIAASLREPAKPTVASQPEPVRPPEAREEPKLEPKPEPRIEQKLEPKIEDILAAARATIPSEVEERPVEWQRPALVVGGVILAVGLVGGLAGMSAGGDAADSQQNAGVTVAVPAAKTEAKAPLVAQPAAPGHFVAVAPPARNAIARSQRRHSPRPPAAFEKSALDGVDEAISQPEASPGLVAAKQASAEAPATEAVSATLPLSNRIIARTIDRIGYSCGSVASATAVQGAEGVYKINCTSGQSYQASPVRGRYHFRRLSRN